MMDWLVERAYAYTINVPLVKQGDDDKLTYTGFSDYFIDLIGVAMRIATAVAVLVIVYGAFLYVTSAGDSGKAREGRDIIVGSLIGLALLLLIRVLMPLLQIQ